MEKLIDPAFVTSLATLIAAVTALIVALKNNNTLGRVEQQTNGTTSRLQSQLEDANNKVVKLAAAASPEHVRAIAPELAPTPPVGT